MRPFIVRGALAGIAGTIASILVLLLVGERSIADAIAIEDANLAAAGEVSEPMYSRAVQQLGGSLGLAIFAILLGIVFGIVFAANRHRLGAGPDWKRARRLGIVGFVTLYLVPFIKYPPNPPAVGDPESIDERTIAYGALMVISVLAVIIASALFHQLRQREVADRYAQPAAVALWATLIGIAFVVLPANPDEIIISVNLAWSFRMASAGGQLAFWLVASTVFGWLMVRADAPAAPGERVTAPDAVSAPR